MPQPGNGDFWPTNDDDRSSSGPTDELPIPDQPEQATGSGSWFDGPPPAKLPKRDEPHASRAQSLRYEEPRAPKNVTWPIAELERQADLAKSKDQNTVDLEVPKTQDDPPKTDWPAKAETNSRKEATNFVFAPAKAAEPIAEPTEEPIAEPTEEPVEEPVEEPAEGRAEPAGDEVEQARDKAEPAEDEAAADDEVEEPAEAGDEPSVSAGDQDSSSSESTEGADADADEPLAEGGGQVEKTTRFEPVAEPAVEEPETDPEASSWWGEEPGSAEPEDKPAPEPATRSWWDDAPQEQQEEPKAEAGSWWEEVPASAEAVEEPRQPATRSWWAPEEHESGADPEAGPSGTDARPENQQPEKTAEFATPSPDDAQHPDERPADGDEHGQPTDAEQVKEDQSWWRPDEPEQPTGTDEPAPADKPGPAEASPSESDRRQAAAARWPEAEAPSEPEPSQPEPSKPDTTKSAEKTSYIQRPTAPPSRQEAATSFVFRPTPPGQPADRQSADRQSGTDRQPTDRQPGTERQPADRQSGTDRQSGAGRQFATDRPPAADRQSAAERATSFERRPAQERRPVDEPTAFMSRPVPAKDQPPSFIRHPTNHDPATVKIARADLPKKTDLKKADEWPPPEPPRAAPKRVGPEPADDEPAPTATKKKKTLLVTAVAIVAVIGIAAGVVFGVPGLSDKLGLTGEPAVAIEPPPGPVEFTPGLSSVDAGAPTPTPQGVAAALDGPMADSGLGSVTGVVIDPATGEALYERGGTEAITPASTGKLLTAAAVLLTFGHADQLVTKVVEGESPGEAIIVGGGDPTLSSLEVGRTSMYPGAAHLSQLVDKVKESGAQIQTVYIDQDRYVGDNMAPGWLTADIGFGYITPIVPAMLDGGRADATVNYSPRTANPGGALVDEFAERLGASAPESAEKKAADGAKVLGEVRSAPMSQLVDNMLDHSDNVLAESLAHELAIKLGKEPSFAGASEATLEVLRQNEFDVDGVVWKDASGLSGEDKVPAKLLAQILAVAAAPDGKDPRTAKLRPLLGGLPVAGGSGTLADRYNEADTSDARGWVRAKTGSLTGVNSLAGIVLDKDNRPLVFAFLTSGTTSTTARPALDRVTAALRGCGCQ